MAWLSKKEEKEMKRKLLKAQVDIYIEYGFGIDEIADILHVSTEAVFSIAYFEDED